MAENPYLIDPDSATWRWIEHWGTERIDMFSKTLETPSLSPDETEFCRGAIQEVRALLQSGEQGARLSLDES